MEYANERGDQRMGKFVLKEGLFEYSVKELGLDERQDALRRIGKNTKLTDDSLKRFMNIGEVTVDNANDIHDEHQPVI